ncbi:DUF2207 domain-containing protein [Actinomadura verrucosospora]|uniref:DUF2207 domain-containing protein n=1 Tax=Actinomadura verrucosospora TaxID=46165 RepID=UPI001563D30A|nr:DUF2207 domain-containing protein [Actinomadura verrucosospora]
MRRILFGAAAACLALLLFAPAASAAPAPEHIRSYAVDLTVGKDGVLHVHERIVYDFGDARRHGIERRIRTGRAAIGNVRAGSPDAPAGRSVTRSGGHVDVRIGDPGKLVTGVHTYTLDYTAKHAVRSDVLDWNAVGTEWKVPIDVATVRLRAPAAFRSMACYAGPRGSTAPCKGAWNTGQGNAAFGQRLEAGQGITVRVALPHGAVREPAEKSGWRVGAPGWLAVAAALLLVAVEVWDVLRPPRWPGMDPAAPVPAVPPAELPGLHPQWAEPDLGAVVAVGLAVRGILRIDRPAEGGPRLRLTGRRDDPDLNPYEKAFMDEVFGHGDTAVVEHVDVPALNARLRPLVKDAVDAHGWRRPWSAGVPLLRFASAVLGVAGFVCLVYGPAAQGAVTDVTAWGAALLVAAGVGVVQALRIDPFTRAAQRLRDDVERYSGGLSLKEAPDAEDVPYLMMRSYRASLSKYVTAGGGPPEWYVDDGPAEDLPKRFAEVATMFSAASERKALASIKKLRTSSTTRRSGSRSRRSGHGGYGHGGFGGFSGGGDGGGVGGGDGGGGGGSW